MKTKTRISFIFFLTGVLILATAGLTVAQNQENLADTQVLRYAVGDRSLPSLDPIAPPSHSAFPIQNMVFESLVRYKPGSSKIDEIQPALAKSWEAADEGRVWTFHLREGVIFHKGYGEFTSKDVKFSLDRAQNPEISSQAGTYSNIKSIETPDKYTVRVILKSADSFFLIKLTNKLAGWLVSEKAVKDLKEDFGQTPVGTGPFKIENRIPKEKVVLVKNNEYWRGEPKLEQVEFYLMPDSTTRTLALLNGEVDVIRGVVSPEWYERVTGAGMNVGYGSPGQLILNFNMTMEPFDDIRIRKAFAYAIGRGAILDHYGNVAIPQYTAVPPHLAGSLRPENIPSELVYEKDVQTAKKLLEEAGYPDGLTVSTVISENPDYLTPMEIWREELKDVGIELQLNVVDHPTFHSRIRTDEYPLVLYGGVRDPIPDIWLYQWYHSDTIVDKESGITNFSHYGEIDANGDGIVDSIDYFVNSARETLDSDRQKLLWEMAQFQLLRDMPVFPSHMVRIMFAWQPYVEPGYKLDASVVDAFEVWEDTRILEN